ncbi:malate synthase [Sarracenia purpurea var. burkii]
MKQIKKTDLRFLGKKRKKKKSKKSKTDLEKFITAASPATKIGGGYDVPDGVDIRGRYGPEFTKILTKDALWFVADLQREFRNHVRYAMSREEAKARYGAGVRSDDEVYQGEEGRRRRRRREASMKVGDSGEVATVRAEGWRRRSRA